MGDWDLGRGSPALTASLLAIGFLIAVMVVACRALARRTGVPYPVFLVLGGAASAFVPDVPALHLEPRVVFLGFLPPLVYYAGVVTSPRELRANAASIVLGAFGLVLATTFAVAGLTWWASSQLDWVGAFILGAVVAPTDPVAATSVFARVGGPQRATTIIEGEGLVNDGVALSLFSLGVAALSSGTGVGEGALDFVKVAAGGAAFGLVVGFVMSRLRRPLKDPAAEIVVSLLVPFVAYLPADALGLSGVLSTLVTGLALGQQGLGRLDPAGRIRVSEFWQVLVFLLESTLFVMLGFQMRSIVDHLPGASIGDTAVAAALAVCAVIAVRMIWWLAIPTLRWRPEGRVIDTGAISLRERTVLGWSGLRGAISLAAALSVPLTVSGRPFAERDLIVFATVCVIGVTLVGQGTSLPLLLRRLGLVGGEADLRQHALADRRCAEAALRLIDEMVADGSLSDETAEALRQLYERRIARVRQRMGDGDGSGEAISSVQSKLLARQHAVLARLHREGEISFSVMREVRRELDLEHAAGGH